MPSGCTCTHAPTQCAHVPDTYWHARAVARGQNVCVQGQRNRSHTPTRSCVQADARWTFAFYIIFMSFWGSCCRDLSSSLVVPAQSTSYLLYSTNNHTCACVEETYKATHKCRSTCMAQLLLWLQYRYAVLYVRIIRIVATYMCMFVCVCV